MSEEAKEFIRWLLSLLGPIALAIVGWFWKQAQAALAMLKRHDELLRQREASLGHYQAMYELTEGGQKPMDMVADLESSIDVLTDKIGDMKEEVEKMDSKIDLLETSVASIDKSVGETKTNIDWIKETLKRIEAK